MTDEKDVQNAQTETEEDAEARRAARRAARKARRAARANQPRESENVRMVRGIIPSIIEATSTAIEEGPELKGIRIAIPHHKDRSTSVDVWLHPALSANRPLVLDLHGGGFAVGDSRQNDALCQWIRDSWDVNVVSVDYRLAPKYPWPAQIEDVNDCMHWLRDFGHLFDVDVSHIYVQGYSAGANLAVSSMIASDREGAPMPQGMILHYPFFDAAADPAKRPHRDIDLSVDVMCAFNAFYVGQNDPKNPLISPVFASDEDLKQLPPMVMLPVEGDCLQAEAHALADHVNAIGGTCEVHDIPGAYHGYIEDAANVQVYEAISVPEQIAARPGDYRQLAARAVAGGLADFLGDPINKVLFPGEIAVSRGEDGIMQVEE